MLSRGGSGLQTTLRFPSIESIRAELTQFDRGEACVANGRYKVNPTVILVGGIHSRRENDIVFDEDLDDRVVDEYV
jgi:hypothetical protein